MKNLPTAFQRNALWTAVTALSFAVTATLSVGLVYVISSVLAYLQPILIPFAVAGVLAYLLEPGVAWLERRGLSRHRAVTLVFALFLLVISGLAWWIIPKVAEQTAGLARKVPGYTLKARTAVLEFAAKLEREYGISLNGNSKDDKKPGPETEAHAATQEPPKTEAPAVTTPPATPAPPSAATANPPPAGAPTPAPSQPVEEPEGGLLPLPDLLKAGPNVAPLPEFDLQSLLTGDWVKTTLPVVIYNAWSFFRATFGGFLGVFGFMLSFIIVPLYLYYFLIESVKIKAQWSDYLPLRASTFKDELVSCLTEINSYLIAFFRGQLFVSVINGIATGVGLMIIGLDFGILIGLALCVAGIIPYLGIAICWLPAVIIAAVQGGSALIPGDPWWAMPLAVTAVFAVVQQIDGLFITPRIVGEAVGLHPMTVIASVLVWSLLLGGLLGAILAVPMTASVKVLFQRYIWRARIAPQTVGGARAGAST